MPAGAGLLCEGMAIGAGEDRRLVLLRHAKSAWPEMPDHERPLARRGQRDAPVMGRWLRTGGLVPDLVLCSTAQRARETWQFAQAGLGAAPPVRFEDRVYDASPTALLDLIRRESGAAETLLVVGHDPGVPGLALTLAGAGPDTYPGESDAVPAGMLDRMRAKFPTAAIAVFGCTGTWDVLGPGSARLACFITPRDLPGRQK
jgi:phosphohistidine phosphatase